MLHLFSYLISKLHTNFSLIKNFRVRLMRYYVVLIDIYSCKAANTQFQFPRNERHGSELHFVNKKRERNTGYFNEIFQWSRSMRY